MRLLNSRTLKLEEFTDDKVPPYAVLSHTWEDGEVTYEDMRTGNAESKKGFSKIKSVSNEAANNGYDYLWVDTCSIDKSSSAELSEAINSMYRWYQKAQVCYAYLADVPSNVTEGLGVPEQFSKSRWFSRGWTLQELIAPETVVFFSNTWAKLGPKTDLSELLSKITGIPKDLLTGRASLDEYSVAERMSWASSRQTTRIEDKAYCLLGIFDVNMPMLYGEGERSFIRLQEHIISNSDDQSIFAWRTKDSHRSHNIRTGLLASSPADFHDSGKIIPSVRSRGTAPYCLTNKGLRIELPLYRWVDWPRYNLKFYHWNEDLRNALQDIYVAPLECQFQHLNGHGHPPGILLRSLTWVGESYAPDGLEFARVHAEAFAPPDFLDDFTSAKAKATTIYVQKNPSKRPRKRGVPEPIEITTSI